MKKVAAFASVIALSTTLFGAEGAALYSGKCAGCHGADGGKVIASMGVKPVNTAQVKAMGIDGLSNVVTHGQGKMPAFAGKLTAEQIKDVCAYVLTLK